MGRHPGTPNSEDDGDDALQLALISADASNEDIAQLYPGQSASADDKSRLPASHSDEEDDLAPAPSLSHLPIDAPPPTTPGSDDLEWVLNLSQLPEDIFDEQVRELHRQKEKAPMATEGVPAPLRGGNSGFQVRPQHHLHLPYNQ